MVRTSQEPIPTTPQLRRSTSTQPRPRPSAVNATPRQGQKTRPVLGEKLENFARPIPQSRGLKNAVKSVPMSKRPRPTDSPMRPNLTRFIAKSPTATMRSPPSSSPFHLNTGNAPRPSAIIPSYGDDSQLLDMTMGGGMDAFETTDESEDELGVWRAGGAKHTGMLTPANSQTLMAEQSSPQTLKRTRKSTVGRQRTPVRLPSPPVSQATQAEGNSSGSRIAFTSHVRNRPSPTPPRRVSTLSACVLDDTFLQKLPSPNPRGKKKARSSGGSTGSTSGKVVEVIVPRRRTTQEPREVSPQAPSQSLPRSTKGKGRSAGASLSQSTSRLPSATLSQSTTSKRRTSGGSLKSSTSSTKTPAPSRKKSIPSTAPARRRQSKPPATASVKEAAKRRASTGTALSKSTIGNPKSRRRKTLTPELAQALSGILPEPIHGSPGDDPLLLKGEFRRAKKWDRRVNGSGERGSQGLGLEFEGDFGSPVRKPEARQRTNSPMPRPAAVSEPPRDQSPEPELEPRIEGYNYNEFGEIDLGQNDAYFDNAGGWSDDGSEAGDDTFVHLKERNSRDGEEERAQDEEQEIPASPFIRRPVSEPIMEQHREQEAEAENVPDDDGDITFEAVQGEWDEEDSGETAVRYTPERSPELPDLRHLPGTSMSPMGEASEWLAAPSSRAFSTSEVGSPIKHRTASATPVPISRRQTPSHTPPGSPRRLSPSPEPTPTRRQSIPLSTPTASTSLPVHSHDFATDISIEQPEEHVSAEASPVLSVTSRQTARTPTQSPSASVLQRSFHALDFTTSDLAQLRESSMMMSSPSMSVSSERTARMASRSPLPLMSSSALRSSICAPVTPLARMAIEPKAGEVDVGQSSAQSLAVPIGSQCLTSVSLGAADTPRKLGESLTRSPFSLIKYRGEVQSSPMVPFSFTRELSETPTDFSDTKPAEEDRKDDIVEQAERMVARLSMPLSPRFDCAGLRESTPSVVVQEASSPRETPTKELTHAAVENTNSSALESLSPIMVSVSKRRTPSLSPARERVPLRASSVMSSGQVTPALGLLSPSSMSRSPHRGEISQRNETPGHEPSPTQTSLPTLRIPTPVREPSSARAATPVEKANPTRNRSSPSPSAVYAVGNNMSCSPTGRSPTPAQALRSPTLHVTTPNIAEQIPLSLDGPTPKPMPRCSNGTPHPSASFDMSSSHLDLSPSLKRPLSNKQSMLGSEGSPQRTLTPELESYSTHSSPRRSPRLSIHARAASLPSVSSHWPAHPSLLVEDQGAAVRVLEDQEAETVPDDLGSQSVTPTSGPEINEPRSLHPASEHSAQLGAVYEDEKLDWTEDEIISNGDASSDEEMTEGESVLSNMTDKTAEAEAGAWDDSTSFDDQLPIISKEAQVAARKDADGEKSISDDESEKGILEETESDTEQEICDESVSGEAYPIDGEREEDGEEEDSVGEEAEGKIVISVVHRGIAKIEPEEDEEMVINDNPAQQRDAVLPVPPSPAKEHAETPAPSTPTRPQQSQLTTTPQGSPGPTRAWQATTGSMVAQTGERPSSQGFTSGPGPSTPAALSAWQAAADSPASPLYPSLENLASPLAAGMSFVTSTPAQHQAPNLTVSLNTPVQTPALRVAAKNNSGEGILALEKVFARRQVGQSKLSRQVLPSSSPSQADVDGIIEAPLTEKTALQEEGPSHLSGTDCDSSAEMEASPKAKGDKADQSIRIKKPRESLYDELTAAAVAKGGEDADNSFNSIVEISSKDPQAAARAAALLKMNHKYIEYGILTSATEQAKEASFASSSSHRVDKRDLLYEAELDLVSQRRSRSRSTSCAPSLAREWEGTRGEREMSVMSFRTDDFPVPGGFVKTPMKRPRSPLPPSTLTRYHSNTVQADASVAARRSRSKSSKAWGVHDWKRLEKAFELNKEAWLKEREVKALPGGLISWARRSTFGQSTVVNEVKSWDAEGFVAEFLEGEGERAKREEWNPEQILLRVHALESRSERSKNGNVSTSSLLDLQTPAKKSRVERDSSVSIEVSSVDTPASTSQAAAPSTLKKMFGYVWGRGGSSTETTQEKGKGLMKDFEAVKGKAKEDSQMKVIATTKTPVIPTTSASRVPASIFIPRSTSTPALTTSASSIPNTSYNSSASYNSDSYSSSHGNSSGRLFPPLEPSLTQRTSAIAKLFPDGASHIRPPPPKETQPIKLPSSACGVKRSGSVKDMARALEESFEKQA
ncbi:hypothetical protein L198_00312 [Cryptococcus wingfieldii CBS 7118]|uniref:Uncharacterized protein n=1 Tax=Cryptococcus wingfieldii CBS 7118 TaxID=1295528 RepID=A0A1E3K8M0_9TREE|nr:hypothetical protein L198_00312 [Cryptococcus wingfieldii CBS 7118]ODO08582.1 hypothetical protein L198_00312 [Cryptococcus wingfieldii CBS 7118]